MARAVQLALGAPVLAPQDGAGEVGADGGVADEGAVAEADGDGPVLVARVAEGDRLAGQEPRGDALRFGGLALLVVAVPVEHAGGHPDAADGESAGDGGDDPQIVPSGGEGVGGDPVLERLARVSPGGVLAGRGLLGDAHRRTSLPLISTTGSPPGTGHWTRSAGTTIATPVRTSVSPKTKVSATWTPGRSAWSSSTVP